MCQIQDSIRPRLSAAGAPHCSPRTRSARLHRFEFRRSQFVLIFALLLGASSADALAGTSGTWTDTTSGGLWSNPSNWSGGVVANGIGAVADFSTLDLTADNTVHLDSSRTIGMLVFGDTTPSNNWTVDNNGGAANAITLATSSGTPTVQVNNQTVTITADLGGTQGMMKTGSGTLLLNSTPAGLTSINGGVLELASSFSRTFEIGGLSGSGNLSLSGAVTLQVGQLFGAGNTGVYSGVISGSGSLAVRGGTPTSPALTLNGADTFSGVTDLFDGSLQLGNANALQNSAVHFGGGIPGGVVFGPGIGTFTFGGFDGQFDFVLSGLTLNDSSGAPITLRIGNNNADSYAPILSGSGSLVKIGTGTLHLGSTSGTSYSGDTTITAGTVVLDGWTIGGSTMVVNVNGGLKFAEPIGSLAQDFRLAGLAGSGNISLTDAVGRPATITVGSNNADTTYSGTISGISALAYLPHSELNKVGTGTLTLSGAGSVATLYVESGTLRVTGSMVNNGSEYAGVSAGADFSTASLVRRVLSGSSYGGFGSDTHVPQIGTGADIRAGRNSSTFASDLGMQWRFRNSSETPFVPTGSISPSAGLHGLVSNVLNLTGMTSAIGSADQTDPFALQIAYASPVFYTNLVALLDGDEASLAAEGALFLGSLDTSVNQPFGLWQNATLGDFGTGLPGDVFQNYQGSWDSFAVANSVTDANIGNFLGSYGVDIASHTVWAVVNHNSQFAVVPEPSSLILLAIGGLGAGLALVYRRRRV
jgi:autotransporter-associated beta strand protein